MDKETKVRPYFDNISLKDFIESDDPLLESRIANLNRFTSDLFANGHNLYRREILSAAADTVIINDPLTNLPKEMIMFGSNNYLGLANNSYIAEKVKEAVDIYGIGIGGPPLLNGNSHLHVVLENRISKFKDTQATMLFSCGFNAIGGWINALVREDDIFFYDEYNHSSLHYALLASRCKKLPFRHNNMVDLRRKIEMYNGKGNERWLVVEGVYSMDGDLAKLNEISLICQANNIRLVIDDAHGTGVFGRRGSGVAEHLGVHNVFLHLGTFSKSFANTGGFISGNAEVINYLRYLSPHYMFSTSMSPVIISCLLAALDIIESQPELRTKLMQNVQYLLHSLNKNGIEAFSESPIVPIIVKPPHNLREIALKVHQAGIFLNPVEYPAVAADKQRLRISMMATHSFEQIDQLVEVLVSVFKIEGVI
ncbi:MAG: pyridoxal phosphate-dependent aminotransferase family protein [Bacteroidetes bacterium]|nr:pyridoxal phosphate-dependent aminotransferase family protein [Bacteroidota bacterium]